MFRRKVAEGIEFKQLESPEAGTLFEIVERNRDYLRNWLPWVDQSHSVADVAQFIERSRVQFEAGLGPNAGIWIEGHLVGCIGCHAYDLSNRNCALGYWIEAGQQGRGTITRCSLVLLDYLFHEVGLHRIEIRCGTGNLRSSAIPRRLGFTQEGSLREAQWVNDHWVDLELWSMLARDWRTAP